MGSEESKIEWTDYTFNPWWGCTKVSAGCKNCYAETWDNRWGGGHWGDNAPRRFFGPEHWKKPLKWNRKAEADGVRRRVFCASMADVFEHHPNDETNTLLAEARGKLWALIEATPHLDWLLLTKRPEEIGIVPWEWQNGGAPPNVWLGTTAENQEQADKRIPLLLAEQWAAVRFVSYEPALGPVELESFVCNMSSGVPADAFPYWPKKQGHGLDWVICGAESGPGARTMDALWVRMMRAQCWWSGIPFFYKQRIEDGRKISLPILDGVRHADFPVVP